MNNQLAVDMVEAKSWVETPPDIVNLQLVASAWVKSNQKIADIVDATQGVYAG